jgi:Fur family transcriptional regulator, ferric uptake regulator
MTPPPAESDRDVRTRSSSKRDAILTVLEQSDGFLSAQDIHTALRNEGLKVGLATVYRTLQALTDSDDLDVMRTESGEATYRSCSASHHHHLVCRQCGKTVEVKGPTVERWADSTASKHGFRDVSHTVEIFGVCSAH